MDIEKMRKEIEGRKWSLDWEWDDDDQYSDNILTIHGKEGSLRLTGEEIGDIGLIHFHRLFEIQRENENANAVVKMLTGKSISEIHEEATKTP